METEYSKSNWGQFERGNVTDSYEVNRWSTHTRRVPTLKSRVTSYLGFLDFPIVFLSSSNQRRWFHSQKEGGGVAYQGSGDSSGSLTEEPLSSLFELRSKGSETSLLEQEVPGAPSCRSWETFQQMASQTCHSFHPCLCLRGKESLETGEDQSARGGRASGREKKN